MQIENRGCKKKLLPQKTRVIEDPLPHILGRRVTVSNALHKLFNWSSVFTVHSTKSRL
jgi:hypothetical protein